MTVCPECHGSQLVGHPAGWLAWQHTTTCTLGHAEDTTRHADYQRAQYTPTTRPATVTERTLLEALGHTPPAELTTTVERLTRDGAVIRRTWPQLATSPPAA